MTEFEVTEESVDGALDALDACDISGFTVHARNWHPRTPGVSALAREAQLAASGPEEARRVRVFGGCEGRVVCETDEGFLVDPSCGWDDGTLSHALENRETMDYPKRWSVPLDRVARVLRHFAATAELPRDEQFEHGVFGERWGLAPPRNSPADVT